MKRERIRYYYKNGYFKNPEILQIEITNRCRLSCPQCYKSDTNQMDMNREVFAKIIEEAKHLNVRTIILNGGEPFEHKKFIDLLELLKNYSFQIICISSGLGITDNVIKYLKDSNLNFDLSISLNGSTNEVNSLSRDGFEIGLNAIRRI